MKVSIYDGNEISDYEGVDSAHAIGESVYLHDDETRIAHEGWIFSARGRFEVVVDCDENVKRDTYTESSCTAVTTLPGDVIEIESSDGIRSMGGRIQHVETK